MILKSEHNMDKYPIKVALNSLIHFVVLRAQRNFFEGSQTGIHILYSLNHYLKIQNISDLNENKYKIEQKADLNSSISVE